MQTHLAYREGSAGRIMDPEFFAQAEGETVQAAIAAIQQKRDLEMIFYLYVVDRDAHLVGVTSLRQLLLSRPAQTLGEIMQKSLIKVHVDTDQEEVAAQAARYDLLAVPVVDDQNRLVGIVTVDDIIDVVKEEATEDLFKLAGSSDERAALRGALAAGRRPSPAVAAGEHRRPARRSGLLLQYFQLQFQDALFLLAFVPVIMGLGGSIGSQTSTVAVRGLATGRLEAGEGRFGAFVVRQLRVAVLLGLACGLLVGVAGAGLLAEPDLRPGRRPRALPGDPARPSATGRAPPAGARAARIRPGGRLRTGALDRQRHHRHPDLLRPRRRAPAPPRALSAADGRRRQAVAGQARRAIRGRAR